MGYLPELAESLAKTESELEDMKGTLEKLRKSVAGMRAAGELLSLEKRAVLTQLTEQRTLYEDREAALNKKLKALKQELHAATTGRITCQELYPVTKIQIGDRELEVKNLETNCNVHIYAGRITVK